MGGKRKTLPSVLLLLLSALGFLGSVLAASGLFWGISLLETSESPHAEALPLLSAGVLFLLTSALNIPTFIFALRTLLGKDISACRDSLFIPANIFLVLWVLIISAGYFASRSEAAWFALAPLTILGVAIPVWWLVEFSRRKLPRSTPLREWGTLTIGLTAAPLLIMIVEILVLILVGVLVIIFLGFQPGFMKQISALSQNMQLVQGGIEELEELLYELARNPVIAGALFLVIGLIVPAVEEIFKPMSVWFLLNRPIKPHEGFSLGLISGGAFALLESAGLVSQISAENWLLAVALRSATSMLHIGLSGMVGYGFARSWHEKRYGRVLLYLLLAAGLHGVWNSLALINGFLTTAVPSAPEEMMPSIAGGIAVGLMVAVFAAVVIITLSINQHLRTRQPYITDEEIAQEK